MGTNSGGPGFIFLQKQTKRALKGSSERKDPGPVESRGDFENHKRACLSLKKEENTMFIFPHSVATIFMTALSIGKVQRGRGGNRRKGGSTWTSSRGDH